MSRAVSIAAVVLCGAAALFWLGEGRRYRAVRDGLAAKLAQREAELAAATGGAAAATGEVGRLAEELRAALEREQALAGALAESRRRVEAQNGDRARRSAASFRAMTERVRRAVAAVNLCLRVDGETGLRVLAAREVEAGALLGVELLDREPAEVRTTLYLAERMELELDRPSGTVTIRLSDGVRSSGAQREEFGADGIELRFAGADGPHWEDRLGDLCQTVGEYPAAEEDVPAAARVDPALIRSWAARIDTLLAESNAPVDYELTVLKGLADRVFHGVTICGYDEGRLLATTISAARMQVVVDRASDAAALMLYDGSLHRLGGASTIPRDGYRVGLPGVGAERAMDLMLGMVVEQ